MARTLSPLAERLLEMVPPYYDHEPWYHAVTDALAREVERLEATAEQIRYEMWPLNATDEYNLLALWETMLGLPVRPAGVPLATRQSFVTARWLGRKAGSGLAWEAAMTEAMGTTTWTYVEGPADYTITIYIPWAVGSFNSVEVQKLARAITPAHLEVAVVYAQGFIIGEGLVGEDRL